MHLLRHKLIAVIVCLFVLAGYALAITGKCVDETAGKHGKPVSTAHFAGQCLCHHAHAPLTAGFGLMEKVAVIGTISFLIGGEFAPQGEPAGIDVPPQLG